MRRYIEHVSQKEPHERRAHAMRAALAVTAALFFVWITTLGVRLSESNIAGENNAAQLANVLTGSYAPENSLEVAPN